MKENVSHILKNEKPKRLIVISVCSVLMTLFSNPGLAVERNGANKLPNYSEDKCLSKTAEKELNRSVNSFLFIGQILNNTKSGNSNYFLEVFNSEDEKFWKNFVQKYNLKITGHNTLYCQNEYILEGINNLSKQNFDNLVIELYSLLNDEDKKHLNSLYQFQNK
jgi:hypothetical protein